MDLVELNTENLNVFLRSTFDVMPIARKKSGGSKPKPHLLLMQYYRDTCAEDLKCSRVLWILSVSLTVLLIFTLLC